MNQLARNWWLLGIRGALGIVLGVVAIFLPGVTLAALVILVGAFAFVDGIANLIAGVRERRQERRWWTLILKGIAGITVGIITLVLPLATALALLAIVATWAIISGALEITAAIRLRREIRGEWLLLLGGLLSVLLGIVLVLLPGTGLLALTWMFGAYLLASGVLSLALAFRLRRLSYPAGTLRPDPARA